MYANSNFGEFIGPLLVLSLFENPNDTKGFQLELWDGAEWLDFKRYGQHLAYWELHSHLQSLLYIVPRKPTLNQRKRQLLEI